MHSELIEWVIVRTHKGEWTYHTEGAQSVFGMTTARKIVKQLGPPWMVRKAVSLELPDED